ncbi:MAG: hypothetical protein ACYDA4_07845 [Ignavibacteriaceae bacterium]
MFKFRYLLFIPIVFYVSIFFGCNENRNDSNAQSSLKKSEKNSSGSSEYFYFVGLNNEKPGLFKYNFYSKKSAKFWFNKYENVLQLSYSPDKNFAFFITAGNITKLGVFSYLTNVRLYLLNAKSSEVFFLKNIGSGFQVFTSWETKNSFKIILNSPDKGIVTYVNQTTQFFNTYGKELMEQTKTYDITEDGYPNPPKSISNNISPNSKYRIFSVDSISTSIYLQVISSEKNILITSVNQDLKQTSWTDDGKFVIFSTANISTKNLKSNLASGMSTIFIYSIRENKIIHQWNVSGVGSFLLINNFLIFDDRFENTSSIKIFEIRSQRDFDIIKIKGGCGLQGITQIPGYSD